MQKDKDLNQENQSAADNAVEYTPPSRGMILLKSSVAAGFIILVVLIALLIITKGKHQEKSHLVQNNCSLTKTVAIKGEIQSSETQSGVITITTKPDKKTGKQEIIRLKAKCGNVINRINFERTQ